MCNFSLHAWCRKFYMYTVLTICVIIKFIYSVYNNHSINFKSIAFHYIICRYVSPSEASWRIFSFPIHGRKPAVERLYFHCEGQNSVYYTDFDRINTVLEKPSVTESMFTSWFEANCKYPEAQNLTYSKFVSKFVYVKKKKRMETPSKRLHNW